MMWKSLQSFVRTAGRGSSLRILQWFRGHFESPSDQGRYLPRCRNLQHGRLGFAPGLDRFLDLLKIVETGRVAPVPFAMKTMSSPGMSRPGTPGVSSSSANDLRMQYSSLLGTTINMRGKTRLRRCPMGLN